MILPLTTTWFDCKVVSMAVVSVHGSVKLFLDIPDVVSKMEHIELAFALLHAHTFVSITPLTVCTPRKGFTHEPIEALGCAVGCMLGLLLGTALGGMVGCEVGCREGCREGWLEG